LVKVGRRIQALRVLGTVLIVLLIVANFADGSRPKGLENFGGDLFSAPRATLSQSWNQQRGFSASRDLKKISLPVP
jgi:hypothetical protein